MGATSGAEIDAWLRQGGLVVTASERAARSLASAFHRARQAEGLSAWNAPNIQDWSSFVREAWAARTLDGRLLLNSTQEQALWAGIAAADGRLATLLESPRYRLAGLAMEAHELLCSHAPRFLRAAARASWQNDADTFSRWLNTFDEACRVGNLLSLARMGLELLELLENPSTDQPQPLGAPSFHLFFGESVGGQEPGTANPIPKPAAGSERPPLLLAGFDRILPVQRTVFDAWGNWQEADRGKAAATINFYEARDDRAELAACALWCRGRLAGNPHSRILVVAQDAAKRRGQIERAFLSQTGSANSPLFEFSLGVPLSQMALPRAAHLMLRWLTGPLAEHELDWLFSTGHAAITAQETAALQVHMRALRSRGLEQPSWTLQAFIQPLAGRSPDPALDHSPVRDWADRMTQVQRRLADLTRRPQAPLDWAELIPQLLEDAAWPGGRPLSSAEFQAARRWQQALETTGSLGFDGRRIDWKDFLSALARALEETLFAPESRDAPIQIAGPAESAGLTADAVWFLGATEDAWPASGATHPLLPPEVQREARMPHATPQLDWDLAQAITARLLASAPEVHFSYSRQIESVDSRPSRLIATLSGAPQPLPAELAPAPSADPLTICVEDFSRIPYPAGRVQGGAGVLTSQSQCPFKAFATARLGAQTWEPAKAGLTPSQRGQLLHTVLHAVWAGPTRGIRSHSELLKLPDRRAFVAGHVQRVFETELRTGLRERMPARYLELEQLRLTGLVAEWLDYESARVPFDVLKTEAERGVSLAGLIFDLRLDRIDRLNDGSLLVIDYKSGDVSPKSWELPRPDDVQLPLYAGFARDEDQLLGGLVFAKLRAGNLAFAGCVGDPSTTLIPGLKNHTALARDALTAEKLIAWQEAIEQLAMDFFNGRAEVDPREYPKTCERCGLQTLCRIQEKQAVVEDTEDGEDPEPDDE
jgi:probable DNA repair protein